MGERTSSSSVPHRAAPARRGGIAYTFYSYKGGVGRSMALANVGALLARFGHKVLVIDWDLEAPGLERYFAGPFSKLDLKQFQTTPGMVDLIAAKRDGTALDWRSCVVRVQFEGSLQPVAIISAGKSDAHYAQRAQGLDWEALFREHDLGNYLDALRTQWLAEFDFVLIDSRTGISDIGGICTILLPDVLVLVFTSNSQSIDGIAKVMQNARAAQIKLPLDRPRLLGVPLPARDERHSREYAKAQEWIERYATAFGELYREWLPKSVSANDALNKLYIPYIATWSFGERLPVIEENKLDDPGSISASYARLARLLASRLDWSSLSAQAEGHEIESAKAETLIANQKAQEEAARSAQLQQQLAQQMRDSARYRRLGGIVTIALLVALGAWQIYSRGGRTRNDQLARAEAILAAAMATDDPLAAQLLIAELGDLPEPGNVTWSERAKVPAIAPQAVVSSGSAESGVVHVRLSPNGSHVAAVYSDGSALIWPADGRGDAHELKSLGGRIVDVALDKDAPGARLAVLNSDSSKLSVSDKSVDGTEVWIAECSTGFAENFYGASFLGAGELLVGEGGTRQSASRERAVLWSKRGISRHLEEAATNGTAKFSVDGSTAAAWDGKQSIVSSWIAGIPSDVTRSDWRVLAVESSARRSPQFLVEQFLEKGQFQLGGFEPGNVLPFARTWVDAAYDSLEICGNYVLALNETGLGGDRARVWKLEARWPESSEDADLIAFDQRRPWLPIHDVSADGSTLATACDDGTVWVWPIGEPHDIAAKDWKTLVSWARESTSACLTVEQRMRLLGESYADAVTAYEACERSFGRTPRTPPAAASAK